MRHPKATHYFSKSDKPGAQNVMAKYHSTANEAYLDAAYRRTAKILETGALRNAGRSTQTARSIRRLNVDDAVDDDIVRELEKDGFIDRVYR